ncbi:DKNYY domain-containing protein [Chitinophaga rhizophila]|uniref:DKNYY domain-containing protein n=1 Tax=Chitinophaga rhizophila TaxID=2866212 RepID=A0ABS7GL64_9BACT|nr:DKNYY domain-containing protein [Chitinophaga rhizophila]MBW8687890.1 DKNYY domain-containing protein [Chitinophaga rhizophila]
MEKKQVEVISIDPPNVTVKLNGQQYIAPVEAYLETWQPLSESYSKDHKGILCHNSRVFSRHYKEIDLETFEVISEHEAPLTAYFRDAHKVYIDSSMCRFTAIPGADPATFEVTDISKGFSRDKDREYYYDQPLPYKLKDARLLNEQYAVADGRVYAAYTRLMDADADSFHIPYPELIPNVAMDKNHVFFRDQIVTDADVRTFTFLPACVDADRAYYDNWYIDFYAKDSTNAWFIRTIDKEMKKIRVKDTTAFVFKVENEKGYGYDGVNWYRQGKKMKK